jgi:hypothetical protein
MARAVHPPLSARPWPAPSGPAHPRPRRSVHGAGRPRAAVGSATAPANAGGAQGAARAGAGGAGALVENRARRTGRRLGCTLHATWRRTRACGDRLGPARRTGRGENRARGEPGAGRTGRGETGEPGAGADARYTPRRRRGGGPEPVGTGSGRRGGLATVCGGGGGASKRGSRRLALSKVFALGGAPRLQAALLVSSAPRGTHSAETRRNEAAGLNNPRRTGRPAERGEHGLSEHGRRAGRGGSGADARYTPRRGLGPARRSRNSLRRRGGLATVCGGGASKRGSRRREGALALSKVFALGGAPRLQAALLVSWKRVETRRRDSATPGARGIDDGKHGARHLAPGTRPSTAPPSLPCVR